MDAMAVFRTQLENAGLMPSEVVPDGDLRRCPTRDKPRSENGWYVFHDDPPAGAFGDWRTGESRTWSGAGAEMDPETRRRIQERIEAARREREAEQEKAHKDAAQEAQRILESLPPATAENPYLKRKGVTPPGLKVDRETLLVPVYGPGGQIMSLQRIEPDGTKRFHPGGRTRGGYFPVKGSGGPPYLAEGIATALSVHEATGAATVLVAFNAGNLQAVAEMARQRYPGRQIIIAGDDDAKTEAKRGTNPGKEAACNAARVVGGKVAFPIFQGNDGTDFSDLHRGQGIEAVKRCLDAAKDPEPAQAPDDWPEPLPVTGAQFGNDPYPVSGDDARDPARAPAFQGAPRELACPGPVS